MARPYTASINHKRYKIRIIRLLKVINNFIKIVNKIYYVCLVK